MGLIAFIILCVVVGFIVWAAIRFVPMPSEFQRALPILAIIVLVVILLVLLFGGVVKDIQIPQLK
jgi:hypothetical protein